jgi:hypothetical protein
VAKHRAIRFSLTLRDKSPSPFLRPNMAGDQEAAYEKVLSANLSRVVDWVKYGDAKNAALLTFASAWLGGIGTMLLGAVEKRTPGVIAFLLFVSEVLFLIAAMHALAALLPTTKPQDILRIPNRGFRRLLAGAQREPQKPNLLFFGDIRHLEPDLFKVEVSQRYNPKGARLVTEAYVRDLCSQTVVNARIAQRKFDLFDRGVSFVLAALFLLIIPFFIGLLRAMFL